MDWHPFPEEKPKRRGLFYIVQTHDGATFFPVQWTGRDWEQWGLDEASRTLTKKVALWREPGGKKV